MPAARVGRPWRKLGRAIAHVYSEPAVEQRLDELEQRLAAVTSRHPTLTERIVSNRRRGRAG
jgi:hypothetical protein